MSQVEYSESDLFLSTLKEYLESEGEEDILKHLEPSKLSINYSDRFSGRLWNQRSAYVDLKVAVRSKKALEADDLYHRLNRYCSELYENTDEYGYAGLKIGVLVGLTSTSNNENRDIQYYSKNQVYENLRTKVHNSTLDPIEEMYILEACACAISGQRLAAVTMLGCAAEQLLLLLSRSYLQYLRKHGSEAESKKFDENVVQAKKAHARLDGFKRTVSNQERLFESLGLENSNLHFQYLDFLRQIRNESGHPTGIRLSEETMNSLFVNYQLLIDRVHPLILSIPIANPV
ncbi:MULTISPECIES: hypothetical protein [Paenibacillus]|uniref:Uncharacterized protein n=1 Tax=Paenibacillus vandeheii TaxID=3035917 RepID=A0ABT8JFX7_9BACL|nr:MULTISPECIES: hypothetical protein [Paenibacillus]KGP78298.1 hypothetical protein P363_0132280 [Paenibacillus sp. MAEPY1]KGP78430.1 hypothetical protein P364_0128755 [Paenibacillus sp. MAEPY2]MDN4604011.1 hypothetical protein [Paenibacillus vandeheii]